MPRLVEEFVSDFSRGLLQDSAPTAFPKNAVAMINNARIEPDGTVSRRWGSKRKHASAIAAGDGSDVFPFTTAAGVEQLLAFVGDLVFVSANGGGTWTDVTPMTGPDSDMIAGYRTFATMRVGATIYLFAANGDDYIWRWNGTVWDELPNAPADVKFIAVFNGRLYATGHNGVIVQASKIADPTVWASPDGQTVQVQTHDGDTPTALYQIGTHLLVFDHNSTSYIDGYGEQDIVVAAGAIGFSRSVGCIAFRSVVAAGDNAVCWLSERGMEYYSPGSGITLLSGSIQRFMAGIDRSAIITSPGRPTAAYDPTRQEVWLALPTEGSTVNDRTIIMSLRLRGTGWFGAATFDVQTDPVGTVAFGVDEDGYLTVVPGGLGMAADSDGYATLVDAADGDPIVEDSDGYLSIAADETLAACLFLAPGTESQFAMHSLGCDAFVREHDAVDLDDMLADGTGGEDITLTVVTRPFLWGRARQRKRVRVVYVESISDAEATYSIGLRVAGVATAVRDMTIDGTAFNQPKREKMMVSAVGDSVQVVLRSTDRVRVAYVGAAAELLREPVA